MINIFKDKNSDNMEIKHKNKPIFVKKRLCLNDNFKVGKEIIRLIKLKEIIYIINSYYMLKK